MNIEKLTKIAQEIDSTETAEYRYKEYEIYGTKFCLGLTLYFHNGFIGNKAGILDFYEKAIALIGKENFTFFVVDNYGNDKKVNKDTFNLLPFWATKAGTEDTEFFALVLESGARASVSDKAFKVMAYEGGEAEGRDFDWTCGIQLILPFDTVAKNGASSYVQSVLSLCQKMKFISGNAGFTVNRDQQLSSYPHRHTQLYAQSQRYWGLDPSYFSASIRAFNHYTPETDTLTTIIALKRVDWLTFLNHQLIDKLGGLEHLTAQLTAGEWGAGIVIHPLPQGICIQAGPEPDIGDVNTNEEVIMPYYHHVGKILKPVTILQNEYGYDVNDLRISVVGSREDTAEWLTRFD